MESERLNYFRSILLERRKFVLETIERLRETSQIREMELEFNENYSNHLVDQESDSLSREESFMFISRELEYLYRIDNALTSIDRDDYGLCKICGKDISEKRLEAVPTTDTCIVCKNSFVTKRHLN
jgi:RNA polymerase-binding protein DksA